MELPVRAFIVDASSGDRKRLEALLLRHPSLDCVGSFPSLADATDALRSHAPRLIFLDPAHAPDHAFDWLVAREPELEVVLVSSADCWAVTAFEVDALDYLPKPVSPDHLNRITRRLLRLDWSTRRPPASWSRQVFVPFERGRTLVALDEICAIQAVGNYTRVLLADGRSEIVSRPLRRWEETLPDGGFLRIHRATLINVSRLRVLALDAKEGGYFATVADCPEPFPVSRRCLAAVRAVLPLCEQSPSTISAHTPFVPSSATAHPFSHATSSPVA